MASLAGKRILLVEDEPILAMSVEDMLADLGCIVVGPALSTSEAAQMARMELLDAALLDVNMGDGESFPVAHILRERRVPFCFATGYGSAGRPAELGDVPVLSKPYTEQALAAMLHRIVQCGDRQVPPTSG